MSTPEVLERVYTIESEIIQIGEAIAIQSNNDLGLSTVSQLHQNLLSVYHKIVISGLFVCQVVDHQAKPAESIEGTAVKPILCISCQNSFFFLFLSF